MTRIFPNAENYLTVNVGISEDQRKEIESRLGFELLPGQKDRFLYFSMTGKDGIEVGTVIAASQKGQYGAVEFVVGLDTDLVIRNLFIQRTRERNQGFKDRSFLDLFIGRSLSDAEELHLLYSGEETPGTSAVIQGLKKELVAYDVLVLKTNRDTE